MRTLTVIVFAALFCALTEPAFAQSLGNVTSIDVAGNALTLTAGSDVVVFKPCTDRILMINYRPNGIEDPDTLVVGNTSWASSSAAIDTSRDPITITTPAYSVRISRQPLRFHVYSSENVLLAEEPDSGGVRQNSLVLNISDARFYGIHNSTVGKLYKSGSQAVYAGSQGQAGGPFTWTTAGWGFLADADGGTFTITTSAFTFARTASAAKRDFECYFLFGAPKQIIQGMHEVTGMPPLFPKYTLGFLNTEWGIDQTELYSDIRTYRGKAIPIDAYILDFDWMDWGGDNYGEFRWGPKFPDGVSGAIVDSLRVWDMHLMGIRKPRVHVSTVQGQYAQSQGFFIDYVNDYFSGKQVGRLNFHNPGVRKWFWESFATLNNSYAKGIRGYWNDEADEYGGNLMFMQMQRAQYEGQRTLNNDRVWSMNRNFYTGAQRYAYGLWSGDIQTGFDAMSAQRLFMISSLTLGASWWSMDIGGFQNTPTPENYYRWIQFGAFVPIFRVHGGYNQEREPWYYGAEAESIAVKYIRLRYSLMPYIYSAAWENHLTGIPLARPMVMEYPDDRSTDNLYGEWLFGSDLLVSPIVTSATLHQAVYLPEGKWYDFHTGASILGPATINAEVPREDIPIFVKAGAIIPMSPDAQYVDAPEMKKTVILSSYPNGSGSALLYDDDGVTYDYEKGIYHTVAIGHERDETHATLTIGAGKGAFTVPARDWLAQFNWAATAPDSVVLDGRRVEEVPADKINRQAIPGWAYDASARQCLVKFPDDQRAHSLSAWFSPSTGVKPGVASSAVRFGLGQNYPNPFNASARISFSIENAGAVTIALYDVLGRQVKVILDRTLPAGTYDVTVDAGALSSGMYFYELRSGSRREIKKMVLQK